jgi:hypothetical protein
MKLFQQSFQDSGANVNLDDSTIHNVSLISVGEAKGHDMYVDEVTLSQVFDKAKQLGTVKVKADHESGVFSTIGYIDNFKLTDNQVLGDLHIYDTVPERERLFEIASKNPNHLGMSLEFNGADEKIGNQLFARCDELFTSALVSDPAANKSLFGKKSVDESKLDRTVPDTDMAKTKKLSEDAAPEAVKKEASSDLEKVMAKLEELESRLNKFEEGEGEDSSEDAGKEAPKAVDPSVEPAVQNPDAEETNLDEDPDKDGDDDSDTEENPDAEEDAKKAKLEEEEKKKEELKKYSKKDIVALAAKLGLKVIPASASEATSSKSKKFSDLLADKTKELGGNAVAAMQFCIKNHKQAYAEYRKSFIHTK